MTAEQWALAERLYHEAPSIAMVDRASWLARACGGDQVVRREVEALLAQSASATGALDGHALDQLEEMPAESLVGRRLGGYELLSLIDEGGMGQVYRARDLTLPREVAVKVISPQFTHDPVRRARFRKEAEVLAAFAHPHIAHIYAFAEAEGRFLLAMELVPGESLAERIARGPLRVGEAVDIAGQVAGALEAAHEQGVVHRDLKPANIRITPAGVVKVLDFGLATTAHPASAAAGSLTRTAPGTLLGTVAYMSPEQARGEVVDKRTDIWAFGCVLFEMLTGVRLFGSASTAETLALVMTQEIDWSRLPAHTPTVVRALLMRCLERDQGKRVGDVAAIRFALEDVARTALAGVRRSDRGGDVAQEPARHHAAHTLIPRVMKGQHVLTIAAALLAVGAAIWLIGQRGAPQDSPLSLPQGTRLTTTGNEFLPAISPGGNQVAYVRRSDAGDSLLIRQSIPTARNITLRGPGARILAVTFDPDGQFVYYVTGESPPNALWRVPTFSGTPERLIDGVDSAIAWSPRASQFAFVRLDGEGVDKTSLWVADTDGRSVSEPRRLSTQTVSENDGRTFVTLQYVGGGGPVRPAWSPDGATIAVPGISYPDRKGFVMFVTVSNGSVEAVPLDSRGPGGEWLDDATLLWSGAAESGGPRQLYSVSYPSGRSERLTTDLSDYGPVSISEQRNTFVTAQADPEGEISILDRSGKEERNLNTSAAPPLKGLASLAWVGGRLLYAADRRGLWTADGVNPANDAEEWRPSGRVPSASADGNVVIYVSPGRDAPDTLWKANREGREVRQIATGVFWPVIHPWGHQAVFLRRGTGLWRVSLTDGNHGEVALVAGGRPDISPDGRRLAFSISQPGPKGVPREAIGYCELQSCSSSVYILAAPEVSPGATPIRWTPDSTGVAYVHAASEQNIWIQPLKGDAYQFTWFTDGRIIRGLTWSPDGRLAILRERPRSNIVLYEEIRGGGRN